MRRLLKISSDRDIYDEDDDLSKELEYIDQPTQNNIEYKELYLVQFFIKFDCNF